MTMIAELLIAMCGGVLGVLFSIPLRKILVHDPQLRFPEGRAIAEILKTSGEAKGLRQIFLGGSLGAFLELLQNGFKLIANSFNFWFSAHGSLFGVGGGFSATMVGAGLLVGTDLALSIFMGAIISWIIAVPIVSQFFPSYVSGVSPDQAINNLWNNEMRYIGIGAMLFSGLWTLIKLLHPLSARIYRTFKETQTANLIKQQLRTEHDLPLWFLLLGIGISAVVLFFLFSHIFPVNKVGFSSNINLAIICGAVFYVLIVGFIFSVVTAYFSGMVGVSASPGSSVVIAGMLFAAWLIFTLMLHLLPLPFTAEQLQAAEAITIIIGSIVTGIAAIANDNSQDLKVGHLVGATPWKQQIMLLLGVLVSSLVIPPVMQLLFDVYGIANVLPHPGMDVTKSLPAPTAAVMAAITGAVFQNSMPWSMMLIGAGIILFILLLTSLLGYAHLKRLSLLGIAIGMYLPIQTSFPLFCGGLMALWLNLRESNIYFPKTKPIFSKKNKAVLLACGLVAGSALMDIFLAVPFSLLHSSDALALVGSSWYPYDLILGFLSLFWLMRFVLM